MNYYIDITLLPDAEINLYFLWQKVYTPMHLALVEIKDKNNQVPIGFSFPDYSYSKNRKCLGNKLRVFSQNQTDLEKMNITNRLSRLADYLHITKIRKVPENVTNYVSFKRVTIKSNKARIARRKALRENISYEKAFKKLGSFMEKNTDLPFIRLNSLSKGEKFPLFISKYSADVNMNLKFNCYGLSANGFLPDF